MKNTEPTAQNSAFIAQYGAAAKVVAQTAAYAVVSAQELSGNDREILFSGMIDLATFAHFYDDEHSKNPEADPATLLQSAAKACYERTQAHLTAVRAEQDARATTMSPLQKMAAGVFSALIGATAILGVVPSLQNKFVNAIHADDGFVSEVALGIAQRTPGNDILQFNQFAWLERESVKNCVANSDGVPVFDTPEDAINLNGDCLEEGLGLPKYSLLPNFE